MEEVINKKSETEIEIVKTIPEQIIPEKIITEVYSLSELKSKLQELQNKRDLFVSYKETPLKEIAKIDKDIENIDTEIASINSKIATAEYLGVKENIVNNEIIN